jgi:thioredoxin-related protein
MMKKLWISVLMWVTLGAHAESVALAKNLQQDGKQSEVMVLLFEAEDCSYCMVMKRDYLVPMLKAKTATTPTIRRIDMHVFTKLTDFDGSETMMADVAERYKIRVTPTLLFVDSDGVEQAKRIVGLLTADFMSYYIDEQIEEARGKSCAVSLACENWGE